ncbi:hypothetical protein [Streptomyces hokutonensis]|uniref:Uncharacterized protein n=1 Tax=Streptomyces hokutonensis TaxID=1306990 RepID=A0ABW6LV21_9ACTN
MGGSEWTSTGPYQKDLESAFRQAQEQKLAEDDHGFPGRDILDLCEDEVRDWAPEGRPTRERWIAALRSGAATFPGRGTGRCTILYRDDEPAEIGYWGCTAD